MAAGAVWGSGSDGGERVKGDGQPAELMGGHGASYC